MSVAFSVAHFDLWVFRRSPEVEYLLLRISEEKANRHFNGGRFWQIPTDEVRHTEGIEDAILRVLNEFKLDHMSFWAAEHTYTIYNRRRKEISIIPVFAAEVESSDSLPLTWEHSEYGWYSADVCRTKIHFRGLKDGLTSVQEYVTEVDEPAPELKLL